MAAASRPPPPSASRSLVLDSALEPEDEDEDQPPANAAAVTDFAEALKTVCAMTEHLASCIDSISSINDPPRSDPVHFFNLSLQVAIREVASLSALPRALIYKSGNPRIESAMKDCVSLFNDLLSHVTRSAELTKPQNSS